MKLVVTHRNADFDAFGAMAAVRLMDPTVLFHFPGGQEVVLRSFMKVGLYSCHEVKSKLLKDARIEKIYLVDTTEISGLEVLGEKILDEKIPLMIVDHHSEAPPWLKNHPHERTYRKRGSTCTIMTELLIEQGIVIPSLEATLLLMGIHEDTGHLLFPETTVEDVRAFENLLKAGADLALVKRFAQRELTPHQLHLLNGLAENAVTHTIHGHQVTIAALNLESFEEDLAYVVHRYVDLFQEEVFIGLFNEGAKIFLIGRSRHPEIDIASVLSEFSGGGHAAAAAGVVRNRTTVELKEQLLSALESLLPPRLTVRVAMSPAIHSVKKVERVEEALRRLNEARINAMPVFSGKEVVGAVTRQLVDTAIHHGLSETQVEEIMLAAPASVDIDAPLEEAGDAMRQSGVRFVVVTDESKVRGIVTRMDVYRHLLPVTPEIKRHLEDRFARLAPNRSSVLRILEQEVSAHVRQLMVAAGEIAEELKMKVYLVGGIVRDLLLGIPDEDVDMVVEGDGITFARALADRLDAHFHSHEKFLTAKLILPDESVVDVATARSEFYQAPAALPNVQASVLRQDLYRRDFTINTLTLSLNPSTFGHLIDFFGGYQDLKSQHIRVLHSLSFIEDPTRCFRAVNLCIRLRFKLSADTEKLVMAAAQRNVFDQLSGNRLWEELQEIFSLPGVDRAVEMMEKLNLLEVIHPDVKVEKGFREALKRMREVLSWASIEGLRPPSASIFVLLLLCKDLQEWQFGQVADRLNFRGRKRSILSEHKKLFSQNMENLVGDPAPSEVYQRLEHVDEVHIYYAMARTEDQVLKECLRQYLKEWRHIKLKIKGQDLLDRGIKPGPHIGRALRETLFAYLDGKVRSIEEVCIYACRLARP